MTLRTVILPDPKNAEEMRLLKEFPRLAKKAKRQAGNRTVQRVHGRVARAIVAQTGVKLSLVRKRLKSFSEGKLSREAKIWLGGGRIPLGKLGAVKQAGDNSAYAAGKFAGKSGQRTPLGGRLFKGKGKLPSSHKFVRTSKARLPIKNAEKELKYDFAHEATPVVDRNFRPWVLREFPKQFDLAMRNQLRRRGLL